MEFAGSELFNHIIERGRMGEDESRRFFQQMVAPLSNILRFVHWNIAMQAISFIVILNLKISSLMNLIRLNWLILDYPIIY